MDEKTRELVAIKSLAYTLQLSVKRATVKWGNLEEWKRKQLLGEADSIAPIIEAAARLEERKRVTEEVLRFAAPLFDETNFNWLIEITTFLNKGFKPCPQHGIDLTDGCLTCGSKPI